MRCSKIKTMLVAYQDGELSPSAAHLVTQHLHRCDGCEKYNERLFYTNVPMPDEPTIEQTLQMHQALDTALEQAWKQPREFVAPARRTSLSALPIAVALLALVTLGLWSSEPQSLPNDIQTSTTAGVVTPDKHWF